MSKVININVGKLENLEYRMILLYNSMITYDSDLGGWDELLEQERKLILEQLTLTTTDIAKEVRAKLGII